MRSSFIRQTNRLFVYVTFLLLLAISNFDCIADACAEEKKAPRLKVGFILPLTGPAADFGVAMKNAIEMAMKDDKVANDRIQPIIEDAQYEIKNAVNAFTSLSNISGVDIVVVWGLGQCKVVAPIAEQHKVPLIAVCLAPDVAKDRPHILRFQSSSDDYMRATTDWLKQAGVKKLGVLLSENGYTEEMFAALERQLHRDQTVTILDRVPATGQDFYTQIMKSRNNRFDAFGLFLAVGQAGTFARQMKAAGLQPLVFGTNVMRSQSEIISAEGGLEGALVSDVRVQLPFYKRYVEQYHSEAQLGFAALVYEVVRLIAQNLDTQKEEKQIGLEVFKRIIASGERLHTVVGNYSIATTSNEGNHAKFNLGMMRIKGNGFTFVSE